MLARGSHCRLAPAAALILATACSHPAAAPRTPATTGGGIAGTVRDSSSGDALSFAEIQITEWGSMADRQVRSASSRADGGFEQAGLRGGLYLVDVRYGEHRVRVFAVPVDNGKTTELQVKIDTGALSSDKSYQYVDMATNPVLTAKAPDPEQHAIAARTGAIRGVVTEIASKQQLPGAVVAATTPGVRDAQLAIADDRGQYHLRGLTPGTYTLSVYYQLVERGNIEVRRTGVAVDAGRETVIDLQLDAVTEQ